jgi:signal transduction histidine kinase
MASAVVVAPLPCGGDTGDNPGMTMRQRLAAVAASAVAAVSFGTAIAVLGHRDPAVPVVFVVATIATGLALASVGALLLGLRPRNMLGPLLYVSGAGAVAQLMLREYSYTGLRADPGSLSLADAAGWAGLALGPVFFPVPLALVLLLFPDGRLPSPRWRPVVGAALALVTAQVALLAVRSGPLDDESFGYAIAWRGLLSVPAAAIEALNTAGVWLLAAAMIALVWRYRRAGADGRQRLKPLALAAVLAVLGLVVQVLPGLQEAGIALFVVAVVAGVPLALAVGALRYRVWDLDRFVVSATVYGLLAVLITGVYTAVAVGLGALAPDSLLPSIAATALVAVVFAPARDRLSRGARRLVYGVRASPYEALAALPHHLAEAPTVDEVLPVTASALTRGLAVSAARVRVLLDGSELIAWSPAAPEDASGLQVVPVRHLGQVVGDVAVLPPADRPLGAADLRLLADLAAQAGPALRAVALATALRARLADLTERSAQLQASRQRIVAAQLAERRRLERDVHDGAQQHLVAAAMRIQTAQELSRQGGPGVAEALGECRDAVAHCIDELRELARGLYPPVLAARGLAAALRARARLGDRPVLLAISSTVDGTRLPPDVEIGAYFCCLEALQNAAKHAPAASVTVSLDLADGSLTFSVTDDGPGFDPTTPAEGTGLLGMADRVGALGGTLAIRSTPGGGTVVEGSIPVDSGAGLPLMW